ncbi:MAG TPA: O-antigen polysaccharide polymerase Wzy [Terracidiphilus sp.]|nr:O-antigen polysaccharide polymerase Wzy [Terracidiphilus sp.]
MSVAGLNSSQADDTRLWAIQYVAMAVEAMIVGACFVRWGHRNTDEPVSIWRSPLRCSWIYLCAAYVPLLLNLVLYNSSLRGLEYVDVQKANLGPEKYILLLVLVTHAAFMRLLAAWNYLGRNSRLALTAAMGLFLYIYIFLMPLRTNLFIFGMYVFYFFGRLISWRLKAALIAGGIILFSWMALHRSVAWDNLRGMGFAQVTVSSLSFGTGMVDMVPWSNEQVQHQGATWGASYLMGLVSAKYEPSVRYVRDKAPQYAEEGGGFGFFYIAELLLNFGYLGGLAAAGLLGMALQKLSTTPSALVRSTVLPALLAASFPLIRNDFLTTLKEPMYMVISCLILDRMAQFGIYTSRLMKLANLAKQTQACLSAAPTLTGQ